LTEHISKTVGLPASPFPHITIAADKDEAFIRALRGQIEAAAKFPFTLRVTAINVYRIWKPTELVYSFGIDPE